jgi:hypothetical protein
MKSEETNDKAATGAEQAAHVAPAKAPSKKDTSPKKGASKAKRGAKPAKAAKAPRAKKGATDARNNKKAEVKRAKGGTLAEIVEATGWQKHTVRGFVSILGSKGGEKIESSKNAAGERSYRIAK